MLSYTGSLLQPHFCQRLLYGETFGDDFLYIRNSALTIIIASNILRGLLYRYPHPQSSPFVLASTLHIEIQLGSTIPVSEKFFYTSFATESPPHEPHIFAPLTFKFLATCTTSAVCFASATTSPSPSTITTSISFLPFLMTLTSTRINNYCHPCGVGGAFLTSTEQHI
jgi:hypothetical protein